MSVATLLGLALLALGLLVAIAAWRQARFKRACRLAFAEVYGASTPLPVLDVLSSYGYPAFRVLFKSRQELQSSADTGLSQAFIQRIDELCKSKGTKGNPFNAQLAVLFTHEGYAEELRSRQNVAP